MKWINIIGLILQFLAFWMAAPELLGAPTMRRLEKGLINLVSALPTLIIAGGSLVFGIVMAIYGFKTGMKAGSNGGENIIQTMIIIGVISVVMMVYIIFFSRKTTQYMTRKIATPLMNRLIESDQSRKSALALGAILFTIGFFLQLLVAVMS